MNSSAELHILRTCELENTRRLHATEFATTSTITFPELDLATLVASMSPYEAGAKNGSGRLRMEPVSRILVIILTEFSMTEALAANCCRAEQNKMLIER